MHERMACVETNIDNIKEDVAEIKIMMTNQMSRESKRFEDMDKKFAAKWVQPSFVTLLIGIVIAVISLLKF